MTCDRKIGLWKLKGDYKKKKAIEILDVEDEVKEELRACALHFQIYMLSLILLV